MTLDEGQFTPLLYAPPFRRPSLKFECR